MAASNAELYKTKGNECYTAKDYWKAIEWYSKAIGTFVKNPNVDMLGS
jgi:hypothetical protein